MRNSNYPTGFGARQAANENHEPLAIHFVPATHAERLVVVRRLGLLLENGEFPDDFRALIVEALLDPRYRFEWRSTRTRFSITEEEIRELFSGPECLKWLWDIALRVVVDDLTEVPMPDARRTTLLLMAIQVRMPALMRSLIA